MTHGALVDTIAVQLLSSTALLLHTNTHSVSWEAIALGCTFGFVAMLSLARPATLRIQYLTGRTWAALVPLFFFSLTLTGTYDDGTDVVFAERVATPFALAPVVGLSFATGAQGALLAVPIDLIVHMSILVISMAVFKLHVAYTHAYLAIHVVSMCSVALGYTCTLKYTDMREAEREAAETFVNTAVLTMALEHRNAQLMAEKERLQWDLASSLCYDCGESTSHKMLCVRVNEGTHRTLGAMKDPGVVAKAVSNANSYDHIDSRDPSPVPMHPTNPLPSTLSVGSALSSVMDTVSDAAAKDITRAPPPAKESPQRPKKVFSEPSPKHKTGCNKQSAPPKRTLPVVERILPDPHEDC